MIDGSSGLQSLSWDKQHYCCMILFAEFVAVLLWWVLEMYFMFQGLLWFTFASFALGIALEQSLDAFSDIRYNACIVHCPC